MTSYEEQFVQQNERIGEGGDSTSQAIIRDSDCVGVLEKKTVDLVAEGGKLLLGCGGITLGTLLTMSGENLGYALIAAGICGAGSGAWRLRKYFKK